MKFYKIVLKLIFLFSLIFSFSIVGFGQTEESEENSEVAVPEQAMEQVVRRILTWSFKPRKKPTTIYLAADGIKQSWLPAIKNIEFELLSNEEIEQKDEKIYFFRKPKRDGNGFGIVFAFGIPNCDYLGDYWLFRISKKRVKLWGPGNAGGGCGMSSGRGSIISN